MPNQPEALDVMRARLPLALSVVYKAEEIEAGRGTRPGELRQHVFDFEDGIRCIVSLDRQPNSHVYLHMSFTRLRGRAELARFLRRGADSSGFWPTRFSCQFSSS